jgi:outer membrane protein OmpA-like peptidoglycan-associated protein
MTVETIQSGNPTRSLIPITKPKDKITTGVILFENDSDSLSADSQRTIQQINNQVKGSPMMIEIRGHTSLNERGANRDSMDLAYARAYMVRKQLIDLGVDPARIYINSMGSNRTSGSVVPSQAAGVSNAYVEVFLVSESPEGSR